LILNMFTNDKLSTNLDFFPIQDFDIRTNDLNDYYNHEQERFYDEVDEFLAVERFKMQLKIKQKFNNKLEEITTRIDNAIELFNEKFRTRLENMDFELNERLNEEITVINKKIDLCVFENLKTIKNKANKCYQVVGHKADCIVDAFVEIERDVKKYKNKTAFNLEMIRNEVHHVKNETQILKDETLKNFKDIQNKSVETQLNFEDFVSTQEKKYERVEMQISEIVNKNIKINENFNDKKFEKSKDEIFVELQHLRTNVEEKFKLYEKDLVLQSRAEFVRHDHKMANCKKVEESNCKKKKFLKQLLKEKEISINDGNYKVHFHGFADLTTMKTGDIYIIKDKKFIFQKRLGYSEELVLILNKNIYVMNPTKSEIYQPSDNCVSDLVLNNALNPAFLIKTPFGYKYNVTVKLKDDEIPIPVTDLWYKFSKNMVK